MSNRRVVSLSMPTAGIIARATTGLTGLSHTPGYVPRHETPVVFSSPSAAATVKAGGVATLTDGDTTQPETQR